MCQTAPAPVVQQLSSHPHLFSSPPTQFNKRQFVSISHHLDQGRVSECVLGWLAGWLAVEDEMKNDEAATAKSNNMQREVSVILTERLSSSQR